MDFNQDWGRTRAPEAERPKTSPVVTSTQPRKFPGQISYYVFILSTCILVTVYPTVVCSWPQCTYSGIFSPKKMFFSEKKIPFFNAAFQFGRYGVFKKIRRNFLTTKKWKNGPKKLRIIGPDPFFPTVQPRPLPTAQNWFSIS